MRDAVARPLLQLTAMRGIASLVLMTVATTGCLSIDDLVARPETPPAVNHPPRFQRSSITPLTTKVVEPGPELNCQIDLKAGVVVDEDVNDELQARWFIDYDPGAETRARPPIFTGGIDRNITLDVFNFDGLIKIVIPTTGRAERISDSMRFTFHTNRFPKGPHIVTLMVSDGFTPNFQDPQEVAAGYGADFVEWFIDTTKATECK